MSWPLLTARDGLKLVKKGARAVDVRSPGEFAVGSIPGFTNIAILNDDHRHQVGLTYKEQGNQRAVELGHKLVDPLRPGLVSDWRSALGGDGGLVCCWRGGMRSEIAADWIEQTGMQGFRIEGGYKSMRRELRTEFKRPRKWIVLEGLTGSGKTELLRKLDPSRVLDLEGLAVHRGSAFGGFLNQPQPAQQTFENAIGLHLMDLKGPVVAENESSAIGRCLLPREIQTAIEEAPLVRVLASMEDRVQRVFAEYVSNPVKEFGKDAVKASLLKSVARISKALGGTRTSELVADLEQAFASEPKLEVHQHWIEILLRDYYDPRYQYGLEVESRKVLFEGDFLSSVEFLNVHLGRPLDSASSK